MKQVTQDEYIDSGYNFDPPFNAPELSDWRSTYTLDERIEHVNDFRKKKYVLSNLRSAAHTEFFNLARKDMDAGLDYTDWSPEARAAEALFTTLNAEYSAHIMHYLNELTQCQKAGKS